MTDTRTQPNLHDKVAVITGGGTGIGATVAEQFAREGIRGIVINYSHSENDANAVVDRLRHAGVDATAVRADISDPHDVATLITHTRERFGRIDILINNAARTRHIPFEDIDAITDDDWTDTYALNVVGAFNTARAAAADLDKTRGAIINIGSVAGLRACGTSIPYSVTKAAVIHLTRCLASALAPTIRVNAVSPGAVASRWMTNHVGPDADTQHRADAQQIPLGRIADPTDIARAVHTLIHADYITGQNLVVDGGRTINY